LRLSIHDERATAEFLDRRNSRWNIIQTRPRGGMNEVSDCAVRDQDFEVDRGIISLTF
jgi:hypothetical protein